MSLTEDYLPYIYQDSNSVSKFNQTSKPDFPLTCPAHHFRRETASPRLWWRETGRGRPHSRGFRSAGGNRAYKPDSAPVQSLSIRRAGCRREKRTKGDRTMI